MRSLRPLIEKQKEGTTPTTKTKKVEVVPKST